MIVEDWNVCSSLRNERLKKETKANVFGFIHKRIFINSIQLPGQKGYRILAVSEYLKHFE